MVVAPLFAVSAISEVLSFSAQLKQAKDTNEYLKKLQEAQASLAAKKAAAEVEGLTARSAQTRKAAAARADEIGRLAREGMASERVASNAAGLRGTTAGEVGLEFRVRLSEQLAYDRINLTAEEDQIQRMLDSVPITQESAVDAQTGAPGPSIAASGLNLLSSYLEIEAKFGKPSS